MIFLTIKLKAFLVLGQMIFEINSANSVSLKAENAAVNFDHDLIYVFNMIKFHVFLLAVIFSLKMIQKEFTLYLMAAEHAIFSFSFSLCTGADEMAPYTILSLSSNWLRLT